MKKPVLGILFGLVVGALAMRLFSEHGAKPAAAAAEPAEAKAPNPTKFPPAKRAAAGIKLGRAIPASLAPELKGFGRVLDAAPFLALRAEVETAASAHEGSAKELDRLRKLYAADSNVSAQAVETAEAAEARDRAALASARMRLSNGWGRSLAGEGSAAVSAALEQGASLVRLDLLPGEDPGAQPRSATVALLGGDAAYPAEILGAAATADPQMAGIGYFALVRDHPLPVGAALRVTMTAVGPAAKVLVIPSTAVIYHQGSPWIYILGKDDTFLRRLVALGRSTPAGIVVREGLSPEDLVAIAGAQQVLSAELQAGAAAEDE